MKDFLSSFQLLNPQGWVGQSEYSLMVQATLFMLIVAVPVFFLIFFFAWRYRASNTKAKYLPTWEHSKLEELIWWAIPFEIILILGALTWSSTHRLDPRVPLDAALGEPIIIQVVALEWKWLFIYKEEGVATVNYVRFPVNRPVRFEITADAPMNSFWIPSLGGQIYAMTGMTTLLHLHADTEGKYPGLSANYSGDGFTKMKFTAEATTQKEYDAWLSRVRTLPYSLDYARYRALAQPSIEEDPLYYSTVEEGLFETILMQFMDKGGAEVRHKQDTLEYIYL